MKDWSKSPKGVLTLWTGVLGGPIAWSLQFALNYPLASLGCQGRAQTEHPMVLSITTMAALAGIAFCASLSWRALGRAPAGSTIEGGNPWDRARFMALLGLLMSALFATAVVAMGLSAWILKVCG